MTRRPPDSPCVTLIPDGHFLPLWPTVPAVGDALACDLAGTVHRYDRDGLARAPEALI